MSRSLRTSLSGHFHGLGGLSNRLAYKGYRAIIGTCTALGLSRLLLNQPFSAEERPDLVSNFKLLHPAETIDLNTVGRHYTCDPFLRSCQDIVEGRLSRAAIFTCEINSAKFSPKNGLVFDARWHNVVESVLDYKRYYTFRRTFRPRRITSRSGIFSSVQHPWHYNNWHWTVDSLPQLRSLEVHMQGRPLTLLMSSEIGPVHRSSLEAILPENFTLEYVDPNEWFELETFVLPSYISARASACFPPDYFDFIRRRTHLSLGTPKLDLATGRYFISRGRAKHRRLINEDETAALLARFGFAKIFMEDYTFAEQVALLRNAEAIVSPHGAGLGAIIYGENLKVCVLYPEARPAGYFYTLALGAGHQHFCTNANVTEHDDFTVDLAALRRVLTNEMRLSPVA
ncbi:hypothetical protein HDF16_000170 [Granulicella aggregans]|uniref:Glycosyltransferase 61 catalytic domain-containing protein n=1 Tax=Granulicella aggregans TaxID=474949 RepID=A0A7W8E1P3_9BACT|nr:glycosyltransferase family 61 protein [Granulicella aggregans]MBB5055501.1 hypothetical protein [Granulicella aggregans]